jgi:hypothetical protein
MALSKLRSQSIDLTDDYAFTGTVTGAGKVLRVVQTVKTDTFSHSTNTFTAITGLSAQITPSSTSSKILVRANIVASATNTNGYGAFALYRDGSVISEAVGDAASNRLQSTTSNPLANPTNYARHLIIEYLDSPASTSALTYQPYVRKGAETVTIVINQNGADADSANHTRSISTITLIEIAQ